MSIRVKHREDINDNVPVASPTGKIVAYATDDDTPRRYGAY